MRSELEAALELARSLPPDELPRLLGDLEEIRATVAARLITPAKSASTDVNLEVSEAAHRLGVSPDYLYRHSKRFPFTRRIGRKLLFSSSGLDSYLNKIR
jgi:excisionase family DNA binding protein